VTETVPVGDPQALAVGEGSAWVSVAGAPAKGELRGLACGEVQAGATRPDVLVASDLPLQGPLSAGPRAMADAIRSAIEGRGFRAGRHSVGYASCDDSTAQSGGFAIRRCAANANAYTRVEDLVAVIGPHNSGCAQVQIPTLNRAPGGPLALVSPSNGHPGLTRTVPVEVTPFVPGQPEVFYPTGERSYARLIATDDLQGAALAMLAEQLGLKSAHLIVDKDYSAPLLTDSFRRAARSVGLRIAGTDTFDPEAASYDRLADKVARSGADGVVLGALVYYGGDRVLKALRARLGPRVPVMASDGLTAIPDVLDLAGRAAHGLYVTISDLPPRVTPAARDLARELGPAADDGYVLQAAQAAEVVMQAIARSDGTRASVLRKLRATRVRDGILGDFRFDRNGDITPAKVTVIRVTGDTAPGLPQPAYHRGAIFDRIVMVPESLSR
jgi:branched-chain amino acid transport system substrate-binding protein